MEANYVHKDSTTFIQDELVKNELNQIELQYNALKQQKFNELLKENQELKKQLEEKSKEINRNKTLNFINKVFKENTKLENQQKEFIEYMNKTIEELECDDVDDEEMKGYLIQRIDTFKEILQKYKEIIGDDK